MQARNATRPVPHSGKDARRAFAVLSPPEPAAAQSAPCRRPRAARFRLRCDVRASHSHLSERERAEATPESKARYRRRASPSCCRARISIGWATIATGGRLVLVASSVRLITWQGRARVGERTSPRPGFIRGDLLLARFAALEQTELVSAIDGLGP